MNITGLPVTWFQVGGSCATVWALKKGFDVVNGLGNFSCLLMGLKDLLV